MNLGGLDPAADLMLTAQIRQDQDGVKDLAARPDSGELGRLQKTAKEFEGVFLNTLMKAMRRTVPQNELFNGGGATKFYRQMHDAEIAKALATGRSNMGIGDLIVQQFEPSLDTGETAPAGAPAPVTEPRSILGPPAPAEDTRPILGPPAPEALSRYRMIHENQENLASRVRLKKMAELQGTATADTLRRFEGPLTRAAAAESLDPALVLAVVMEESAGDPAARSAKGATGLMQLMPGTAREVGVRDSEDPVQNLAGGTKYLSRMVERYPGRLDLALAAYNAGPGNVDRAGGRIPGFEETRNYVRRVLDRYRELAGGTKMAMEAPWNGTPNVLRED